MYCPKYYAGLMFLWIVEFILWFFVYSRGGGITVSFSLVVIGWTRFSAENYSKCVVGVEKNNNTDLKKISSM